MPPLPKTNLKPPTKNRRNLYIAGGVVALAVIVFLVRRSQAQAPAASTLDPNAATTPQVPTTFADNGAQAASLGDSVTSGLAGITSAFQSQGDAFATLAQQLANAQAAAPAPSSAVTVNVAAPAAPLAPSAAAATHPAGPGFSATSLSSRHITVPKGVTPHYGARAYLNGRIGYLGPGGGWHPGNPPH